MANMIKSSHLIGKLSINSSVLFLCDMQEKFRSNIQYFNQVVEVSNRLLKSFKLISAPVICTEQYPKGLGSTVPELEIKENSVTPIEKTQFSMCLPPVDDTLQNQKIKSVILCGIEAHVCIQNTALDLLEKGFEVHVVVDAVSSRTMVDRMFAFQRMKQAGAFLTTSEAVILGLIGGSHHPKFKELQKLIMTPAPDSGLLTLSML